MLVHCQALGDNEFCLEVFEVGVIETELALQSTIGDTATVAEQRNNLIDDLVKVHASPFLCISPQGMSQCCGAAYQNRDLIAIAIGMRYPTVYHAPCVHLPRLPYYLGATKRGGESSWPQRWKSWNGA